MAYRLMRIGTTAAITISIAALVWANRAELPAAGRALGSARPGWLIAGMVALGAWWAMWVLLHASARRAAGVGGYTETGRLIPLTMGAIALNQVVKSGGLAGMALFIADGRRRGLPSGRVSGAYLLAVTLAEVAFAATLLAAVVVTWADGHLTRVDLAAVGVFTVFLTLRGVALIAALRSRQTLLRVWTVPARVWDRLRRRPGRTHDTSTAEEVYHAVALLRERPTSGLPALGFAVGIDIAGVVMLWTAIAAVGGGDHPVTALIAYAISALFGIIGFLPGGLGFVEVGAAAVLTSFGIPIAVAAAAVVVFRVWEFWLPLAAGGMTAWWSRRHRNCDPGDVLAAGTV